MYGFASEDEYYDARDEARRDEWADNATECGNCGNLWDPGYHRATRVDPSYYECPECPACGEWSVGDDVPERDVAPVSRGCDTTWIADLFAEQFPPDPTEEEPF